MGRGMALRLCKSNTSVLCLLCSLRSPTSRLRHCRSIDRFLPASGFNFESNPGQFSLPRSPISDMMNRGGGGGSVGSGSGPTAAATAAAAQKQKALLQRVETDIGNIVDNFNHLVNVVKVNDTQVGNAQEAFMMEMRASRMVQAADSLLKLVSELKQTAIFSGFASLNDHVEQRISNFNQMAETSDRLLSRIAEEAAASLKELETHYYSSAQRAKPIPEP